MLKYRIFQVIMALSLVMLIISSGIMGAFMMRNVSRASYKPISSGEIESAMNNGQTGKLSDFEAWVEYSIVSDGLDYDGEESYRKGSIYLSTENVIRLEQLKEAKKKASNGVFISIILIVACFVVIRRRRLYECVVWGGAAGVIIGLISFLTMLCSKSGVLFGIKKLIFEGSGEALFPGHDVLADILPVGLGERALIVYLGAIFAGLVVTIVVRVISYKKSRPHKFR